MGSVSRGPPADQHDRVPDPGRQPPCRGKHVRILSRDQPCLRRRVERGERARGAQPGRHVCVLQLKQLHDPLDVGQPATPELEVTNWIGTPRQPFGFNSRFYPPNLPNGRAVDPPVWIAQRVQRARQNARRAPGLPPQARRGAAPGSPRAPTSAGSTPHRRRGYARAAPDGPRGAGQGRWSAADRRRGMASSRRNSSATACAARVASPSSAPGSGSCTNMTSASLAKPISWPPKRPMATTRHPGRQRCPQLKLDLLDRGLERRLDRHRRDRGECLTCFLDPDAAEQARHGGAQQLAAAQARTAATPSSALSCRQSAASASAVSAARGRG